MKKEFSNERLKKSLKLSEVFRNNIDWYFLRRLNRVFRVNDSSSIEKDFS